MSSDYILFLDTETSGLPKNWNSPYSSLKNWPSIIQFAWIITDLNGKILKKENFYVRFDSLEISNKSYKIHKISLPYLKYRGKNMVNILELFFEDLKFYNPIIVGHFLDFDIHMIKSESFRNAKSADFLNQLPKFCTMQASKSYSYHPDKKLLKLNEFYNQLFNKQHKNSHNALSDALMTMNIFFELLVRKNYNLNELLQNGFISNESNNVKDRNVYMSYGIFIFIIFLILIFVLCKLQ